MLGNLLLRQAPQFGISSGSEVSTNPTFPATLQLSVLSFVEQNTQILAAKWVSIFAMGLGREMSGNRITAMLICLRGYWFNMSRVYANSISAKMVALQSVWNSANKQLVKEPMSEKQANTSNTELTIARGFVYERPPFPTRHALVKVGGRDLDFGKQSSVKDASRGCDSINVSHRFLRSEICGQARKRVDSTPSGRLYYIKSECLATL
jgi:hypothetical protein